MWLHKRGKTAKGKIIMEIESDYGRTSIELGYWRKDYDLHEKFLSYASLELEKDLNCQAIILSKEDLIEILEWVKKYLFKVVASGEKIDTSHYTEEVLTKAIKETDFENEEVYYYAWW